MPDIAITKCAVHQVDHTKQTGVVASTSLLRLDSIAHDFFRDHIGRSLAHRQVRTGVFAEHDPEPGVPQVSVAARSALAGADFLAASVEIAEALFIAIGDDRRVSASDLFVCELSLDGTAGAALAILKMDLQLGLRTIYEKRSDGTIHATLESVPDVITDRELQKVALVYPEGAYGYDVSVLDTQGFGGGYTRPVATFFMRTFLNCEINLNAQDVTSGFIDKVRSFSATKRGRGLWTPHREAQFRAAAHAVISSNHVDVVEFAQRFTGDEVEAEEFVAEFMKIGRTDKTFEPDRTVAERLRPVKIELPNSIVLTAQPADAEDYYREPTEMSIGRASLLPPGQRMGRVVIGGSQFAVIRIDPTTRD